MEQEETEGGIRTGSTEHLVENVMNISLEWTITEYTETSPLVQSVLSFIEQLCTGAELGTADTKMISTWSPLNTLFGYMAPPIRL